MERNSSFIKSTMFQIWRSRMTSKYFIIFLSLFIVEILLRNLLYNVSLPVIVFIQKHFSFLSGLSHFFSFFGTPNGIIIPMILTYNFANCYKTFMLMSVGLFGSYFGGLLKIIYASPRPFWSSVEITAFGCEGGWGNPSNHALVSVSFYMTLYYIFIENAHEALPENTKKKYLTLTILFIFSICFSRVFLGVHSINQVLFGAAIGYLIYYFFFNLLCLDTNDPNELIAIILSFYSISFFLILLSLVPLIPNWIIHVNSENKNKWNTIIEEKCPNFPHAKRFQLESFLCTWPILAIIPSLFGMYIEYLYILESKISKWSRYNFDPNRDAANNLLYKSELQKTCWNNTEINASIKRILLTLAIALFIMIPHYLVSYHDNFVLIVTIKLLVPMAFLSFIMFSYLKMLFGMINLANIALFTKINTPIYSEPNREMGIRDNVNDFF